MKPKIPYSIQGVLDPTSDIGRATITEYVVLEVLGDCTKEKMNYKYDLTSSKYGSINVKSSKNIPIMITHIGNFTKPLNHIFLIIIYVLE